LETDWRQSGHYAVPRPYGVFRYRSAHVCSSDENSHSTTRKGFSCKRCSYRLTPRLRCILNSRQTVCSICAQSSSFPNYRGNGSKLRANGANHGRSGTGNPTGVISLSPLCHHGEVQPWSSATENLKSRRNRQCVALRRLGRFAPHPCNPVANAIQAKAKHPQHTIRFKRRDACAPCPRMEQNQAKRNRDLPPTKRIPFQS